MAATMTGPKIFETRGTPVACPFFMPVERLENGAWLHVSRLPLACGWHGTCTAPGHEGELPTAEELRDFCNLGYAESCPRLPRDRAWDAVRFSIVSPRLADAMNDTTRLTSVNLRYVCERAHRPAEHGTLEFDPGRSFWVRPHADCRVQRMAECFLAEYLSKKKPNYD
jgi:hypothetical protein